MRTDALLDLIDNTLADRGVSSDAVRYNPNAADGTVPPTANLLVVAADYVTSGARHGSPSMLMRRLHQEHGYLIGWSTAEWLLTELYACGVVGPLDTTTHAYPVLMTSAQARTAVERHVGPATVYECPNCCRVSPWTNGRSIAAGDDVDEFWCPTCGSELLLASCNAITA